MFLFSYSIALVLQLTIADIGTDTLKLAMTLAPATVIGIFAGRRLSRYLTEETFRTILLVVLVLTVVLLVATIV